MFIQKTHNQTQLPDSCKYQAIVVGNIPLNTLCMCQSVCSVGKARHVKCTIHGSFK